MPRAKALTRSKIVEQCMALFWRLGFASSSIDDLVRATGTTRHSIYLEFGGKEQLFAECLIAYSAIIVTPAFARVETGGDGLGDIAGYFEHQIALVEKAGLPGPGCLMANTMTELAPHNARAVELVRAHQERLRAGFERALSQMTTATPRRRDQAEALVIFANGLWSISRITKDPNQLRRSVGAVLHAIEHDV